MQRRPSGRWRLIPQPDGVSWKQLLGGFQVNHNQDLSPLVSVSVASKGLGVYVSGLESTLADISISVDSKEDSSKMIRPPSVVKRHVRSRAAGRWAATETSKSGDSNCR